MDDSDCCYGSPSFWTGEPIPHEVYMSLTPWFICQYHICYGFMAPESSDVCYTTDQDVDCDGWFQ